MRVYIASDHAGYCLKERIKRYLVNDGDTSRFLGALSLVDLGTDSDESVDYPYYAASLANAMYTNISQATSVQRLFGILICGTGMGMSMKANRYPWIRAALCYNPMCARLAREHNDANVLVLGSRVVEEKVAVEITHTFFSSAFIGGRHQIRVDLLGE